MVLETAEGGGDQVKRARISLDGVHAKRNDLDRDLAVIHPSEHHSNGDSRDCVTVGHQKKRHASLWTDSRTDILLRALDGKPSSLSDVVYRVSLLTLATLLSRHGIDP